MTNISVIIPAHNVAQTIQKTLQSLLSERDVIGEIILVDDRSEDDGADVAKRFSAQCHLPLLVISVNAGSAGAARNAGLEKARFPYIFFIDADDTVIENGLTNLFKQLDLDPSSNMVVGNSIRLTEGLKDKIRNPEGFQSNCIKNAENYLLNIIQPISMGSALIRKELTDGIRFPSNIALDEDTWFWSAILTRAKVISTSTPVMLYYLDANRMADRFTKNSRSKWLKIAAKYNRLQRYGISKEVIAWRKTWVAFRFARFLRYDGQYKKSQMMMRPLLTHKSFRNQFKTIRYQITNFIGSMFEKSTQVTLSTKSQYPEANIEHKAIILSYDPIVPAISGSELRTYQIASSLSKLGPTLAISVRPQQSTEISENFDLSSLSKTSDNRTASINKWRCSIEPRLSALSLERLKTEITKFKPQTIIISGVHLGSYIADIRPMVGQIIVDMHNIESELLGQISKGQRNRVRSIKDRFRLKLLERQSIKLADQIWTCTVQDEQRLIQNHSLSKPTHVVQNPVPRFSTKPDKLPYIAPNIQTEPVILYIGHLGYIPNVDAVERLITKIFPIIQNTYPAAKLLIAGRYPTPLIRRLTEQSSIELFENPEQLNFLFERSHISIVPLVFGGGSRLKILEVASMGIPIVASPLAAEGLGFTDTVDIMLGEDDQQLADTACELISNHQLFDKIRTTAFKNARSNFSPEKIDIEVKHALGLSQ